MSGWRREERRRKREAEDALSGRGWMRTVDRDWVCPACHAVVPWDPELHESWHVRTGTEGRFFQHVKEDGMVI